MIVDGLLLFSLLIAGLMSSVFYLRRPSKPFVLMFLGAIIFVEIYFGLPWLWQISGIERRVAFAQFRQLEIRMPEIQVNWNFIFFIVTIFLVTQICLAVHELIHHRRDKTQ